MIQKLVWLFLLLTINSFLRLEKCIVLMGGYILDIRMKRYFFPNLFHSVTGL
nr:MAG TPA: hypothetical protein [Caudoviricetes sp.]